MPKFLFLYTVFAPLIQISWRLPWCNSSWVDHDLLRGNQCWFFGSSFRGLSESPRVAVDSLSLLRSWYEPTIRVKTRVSRMISILRWELMIQAPSCVLLRSSKRSTVSNRSYGLVADGRKILTRFSASLWTASMCAKRSFSPRPRGNKVASNNGQPPKTRSDNAEKRHVTLWILDVLLFSELEKDLRIRFPLHEVPGGLRLIRSHRYESRQHQRPRSWRDVVQRQMHGASIEPG